MKQMLTLIIMLLLAAPSVSMAAENSMAAPTGCGEVCVRVLAAYFGKMVTPQRVQELLQPNSRGECSLADIHRCLGDLGLGSKGFEGHAEDLRHSKTPFVL